MNILYNKLLSSLKDEEERLEGRAEQGSKEKTPDMSFRSCENPKLLKTPSMAVYSYNSRTWETEAGGLF